MSPASIWTQQKTANAFAFLPHKATHNLKDVPQWLRLLEIRLLTFGIELISPMPNPKCLDPSLNQQRIPDSPTSYQTIRQYLNYMQWVGNELSSTQPLTPHVICMKLDEPYLSRSSTYSTHPPISHLPLSLKRARTRKN